MDNSLLGGSQWNTYEGWDEVNALTGYSMLIGYPMQSKGGKLENIKDKLLAASPQRHFLSVAPTRSGKGVSLIIPNLLLYKGSVVVIDPKGENAWITAEYRREVLKQKTIILDPWGEVNRRYGDLAGEQETVAHFNPLSILNPESEHYADDIAYLADALIINQGKDPHWDDSARELVAGLMAYVVEHPEYRKAPTLKMLRILLSKPISEISGIAEDAIKLGSDSLAARKLGRFAIDSKETSSIISTALTQTAFLDSKTLADNMKESDFSFEDLINGQATIYVVLPVDKLQTYGRWLRLMVSIGIRTVARNVEPLPLPCVYFLDEFGSIGKLSAVSQAYGLMAGLQMIIWAFVQDLNQLKRDYPDEWETFIGNSQAVTFMNVMDQFTAKYLSELCGVTTVERVSQTTADRRQGGFLSPADPNYSAMADQVFSRPLIQPAEIRSVTRDLGIMIWPYQPIDFRPILYYDYPFFIDRARIDPHFPAMRAAKVALTETKIKLLEERFFNEAREEAKKEIPKWAQAKPFLIERGYKLEDKGIVGQKTHMTYPDGTEEIYPNVDAVLEMVWTLKAKERLAEANRGNQS